MAFRDTILSDHEWSEEEDNGIDLTDDDDDDEIALDHSPPISAEKVQSFYRVSIGVERSVTIILNSLPTALTSLDQ